MNVPGEHCNVKVVNITIQPRHVGHSSLGNCRLLGVSAAANSAEIKAAYRQKALTTHPDVSDAEDASERFAALSAAYGAQKMGPWLHLSSPFCFTIAFKALSMMLI